MWFMNKLSHQQLTVLTLIASCLNTKEIAGEMAISPKTVEFHRHALQLKLRVFGAVALTKYAIRHGIVKL